jgi:hypothetical protein
MIRASFFVSVLFLAAASGALGSEKSDSELLAGCYEFQVLESNTSSHPVGDFYPHRLQLLPVSISPQRSEWLKVISLEGAEESRRRIGVFSFWKPSGRKALRLQLGFGLGGWKMKLKKKSEGLVGTAKNWCDGWCEKKERVKLLAKPIACPAP